MIACIVLVTASLAIASMLLVPPPSFAQTTTQQEPTGNSVTIEIANKFQQVVPATATKRQALRITNNNSNNDSCWVYIGGDKASKGGANRPLPLPGHLWR
jgi:biopolymer transport protein ExbD